MQVSFADVKRGLFLTLAVWAVGFTMLRSTLLHGQVCPALSPEDAVASARAAASWIEENQRADGSYVYEYNIADDRDVPGYNVVRHAGVTMSLYQLAASGDLTVMPTADRGLDWMLDNLYTHEDWSALQDPGNGSVRLGASALMLAGLTQRRLATGDPRYDDLSRELARGMLVLQLPDGAFLNEWDTRAMAPDPDQRSKYATGEAFWALALMHRIFPGEGWDARAWRTADYLALARDEVEDQKFPPWADQWAAYGLGEMAGWGLKDHHITYARSLAERFGLLVRAESQRDDSRVSKLLLGRQARAAGMGTWVEGLTSLHHLATVDPRMASMAPKIAERIACSAGMLAERQYGADDEETSTNPARITGAWFTEDLTRMDDQQHALSGLLASAPILAATEGR